ncbi:SSrecog-domain-containing protein [Caulochytrium protostelioides]|uniref:FACT complex subunit POB3 n=1 Tax=Caulochytrium protostelioides TaxID=1555241 RepID=A0A4P9WWI3_9FUNG|nr:SSrecog-domain-containing protein [Caulochytrium protostelioides]
MDDGWIVQTSGKLRFAEEGIGWRESSSSANSGNRRIITIAAADLRKITFMRAARGHALRFALANMSAHTFDNIPRDLQEPLQKTMKQLYDITMDIIEPSIRGWNWGATEFQGAAMNFVVGNRPAFELPMTEVANTTVSNRDEVSIEFTVPPVPPGRTVHARDDDMLMEMIMYVPGGVNQSALVNDEGDRISAATVLHETIKQKADVGGVPAESMATVVDMLSLTFRSKFNLDFHKEYCRLRGKTHDYRILYTSITHLLLVPKPDDVHWLFTIGLDPPLRSGQTLHPFVTFQYDREEELEMTLDMTPEKLESRFNGRLNAHYDGPVYDVMGDVFAALTNRRVVRPSISFTGANGQVGIECSRGPNEAFLYCMERAFFSVPKPPVIIPHADIDSVTFSRVGTSSGGTATKSFEVRILMHNGTDYTFSSVAREEYPHLEEFCRVKKLKVKSAISDDDDFDASSGDDDGSASSSDSGSDSGNPSDDLAGDSDSDADEERADVVVIGANAPAESAAAAKRRPKKKVKKEPDAAA